MDKVSACYFDVLYVDGALLDKFPLTFTCALFTLPDLLLVCLHYNKKTCGVDLVVFV